MVEGISLTISEFILFEEFIIREPSKIQICRPGP